MKTIDERIVDMQFNGKQFEQGIKSSVASLDTLKKSLDLSRSVNNLAELDRAGKRFSLSGIASGLDQLNSKFSAMSIIGITAITNIANSAINSGRNIMRSLTVDPIKLGLQEYETKMNAIQTILTNTASKGTTLKEVNNVLADLNNYSDKTIYNFAEMARNIGTFTAAGVDLKVSATAIKGIANLAAGSGSNAQQASTAMYQLSQALAAGSVKLMDWNSVVNAGMGGELFQNALRKTAKEMGIVVKAGVPFRETLESGWVTSKVLTATLTKFANDKALIQAATQVKTFTQLLDTMKETVQSGWAVSWETIIGNKDEAAKLFTAINDGFGAISGSAAEARNTTLSFWKANGGRESIINGLASGFKNLTAFIKPVNDAFKDIFPPTTGQQLVNISNGFETLMKSFKMGEETSTNIHRTFTGLFAILDIGKMLIFEAANAIGNLVMSMMPVGGGLLTITARLGDAITGIRDAMKEGKGIAKFIDSLQVLLAPTVKIVQGMVKSIGDSLTSLGNIDLSNLDTFAKKMEFVFGPLITIGKILANGVSTVLPIINSALVSIGTIINKLFNKIAGELKNLEFETIISILNGAFLAGLLSSISKFVKQLTNISGDAKGMLGNIKGLLDGVGGSLEAYQKNLQAKTLMTIALAVGVLAGALVLLSTIDSDKLNASLGAIAVLFAQMFAANGIFGKIVSAGSLVATSKMTLSIVALSTGILILTSAMKMLADLSWEELGKGLLAMSGLCTILAVTINSINSGSGGMNKSAIGLLALAGAISILTDAVRELGTLKTDELAKGLIGVGVLLTELNLFMKFSAGFKMGPISALGLIGVAVAINILVSAVSTLGNIPVDNIKKGLGALGVLMVELILFLKLTGNPSHVISTAIGLTILGVAMQLFVKAITDLGTLKPEEIAKGLGALGGALLIVAVAMKLMPNNMIITGTSLIAVGIAINMLALALTTLGDMSLEEIGRGLLALGGGLGILATAMLLMTGGLPGAAALLVMAGALAIFVPAFGLLSSIPFPGIMAGLIAMAGAFTIIGVAGLLLGPMTPVLLGLAASLLIFGGGLLTAGTGVSLFATGIALLINSLGLLVTMILKSGTDILKVIPTIFKILGESLTALAGVLKDSAPALVSALVSLIGSLLKALDISIPMIVKTFTFLIIDLTTQLAKAVPEFVKQGMNLLIGLLKGLSEKLPELIAVGADLIIKLLQGIASNIGKVAEAAINIVVNFIVAIATMIPKVIDSGFKLILAFINGLAEAIRTNTPLLVTAVRNLISAIIEAGLYVLTTSIPWFLDQGGKVMNGLFVGISNSTGLIVKGIGDLMTSGIKAISDKVSEFTTMGKNVVDGFIKGITGKMGDVATSAIKLASNVVSAAKGVLGIHSPSKVFEKEVGEMIAEGMAKGIKKKTSKAVEAANEMSKKIFETAKAWIDERKQYNNLSLQEELYTWQKVQKSTKLNAADQKQVALEVYNTKREIAKSEFDNSLEWISERKYYNELSLTAELALWEKVQARYAKRSEERKQIDREVYRVKQELTAKKKALEDEYYAKTDEVNAKLLEDIITVNNKYKDALKSRTDTLYSTYGLFDELDKQDPVSGTKLISNLADQVAAFDKWKNNIGALTSKGVDEELIAELRTMGPKAVGQIEALNTLSATELTAYVAMWKSKHEQARLQSINELVSLRISTTDEIDKLNADTKAKLTLLTDTFRMQMVAINSNTIVDLEQMNQTFTTQLNTLNTNSESKFVELLDRIEKIDWVKLGVDIIKKVSIGVESQSKLMTDSVVNAAKNALKMAQAAIANGLNSTPVITPVLDLSGVDKGLNDMNDLFKGGSLIASTIAKLPSSTSKQAQPASMTAKNVSAPVTFVQNNYSPKELSRVDIYRDTKNLINSTI